MSEHDYWKAYYYSMFSSLTHNIFSMLNQMEANEKHSINLNVNNQSFLNKIKRRIKEIEEAKK